MRTGRPKKKPSFDAGKLNETTLRAIKEGFEGFIQIKDCNATLGSDPFTCSNY